jgi:hypothetical protein
LRIQYRFAVDTGSTAGTGAFCVAGSATNEYPLLTYSNIRMSSLVYRNTDPRLAPKGNYVQVIDRFHTIIKNGAFNTADTDKFTIKLKSDFPDTNSCKGLMIWGESPDNRTAYNDADNGVVVSIPETLCPELRLNSNVMWSHKLSATDLIKRRRYNYDVQMRNFSTPFEASAQASGNAQNKYLIPLCYIDFSCIEIFDQHEQTITGIPSSTNIEIDVHCGTTGIDADNTNLHIALHYIEMVTKENGIAKVNNNPTA